jgi:hypothetical protein
MQTILDLPEELLVQVELAAEAMGQSTQGYVAEALRERLAQAPPVQKTNGEPAWLSLFGALAYLGEEEHERIRREIEDAFEQIEPEIWQ